MSGGHPNVLSVGSGSGGYSRGGSAYHVPYQYGFSQGGEWPTTSSPRSRFHSASSTSSSSPMSPSSPNHHTAAPLSPMKPIAAAATAWPAASSVYNFDDVFGAAKMENSADSRMSEAEQIDEGEKQVLINIMKLLTIQNQ